MCNIDIAILSLMLASEITRIVLGFKRKSSKILSRVWIWAFLTFLFLHFTIQKEKKLEKLSTNWSSDKSSNVNHPKVS